MAELELELNCENCGSQCRIIYDSEQVHYDPETCPFCGEIVGMDIDDLDEDEELALWGDDGMEDEDDDHRWN
jgi:hypothetical protein